MHSQRAAAGVQFAVLLFGNLASQQIPPPERDAGRQRAQRVWLTCLRDHCGFGYRWSALRRRDDPLCAADLSRLGKKTAASRVVEFRATSVKMDEFAICRL